MCKKRIEIASLKVKGIKMATWDIPSNIIRVIYNPNKVEIKSLQKAIADIGHDTPLFKATKQSYNSLPKCCLYKEEKIHQLAIVFNIFGNGESINRASKIAGVSYPTAQKVLRLAEIEGLL